jgi:hypothetical protein
MRKSLRSIAPEAYKRCIKRNQNITLIDEAIKLLTDTGTLPTGELYPIFDCLNRLQPAIPVYYNLPYVQP